MWWENGAGGQGSEGVGGGPKHWRGASLKQLQGSMHFMHGTGPSLKHSNLGPAAIFSSCLRPEPPPSFLELRFPRFRIQGSL